MFYQFLSLCALGQETQLLELLQQNDKSSAMINWRDTHGFTGLHYSLLRKHFGTAKLLLQHKALVNIPDMYGTTADFIISSYLQQEVTEAEPLLDFVESKVVHSKPKEGTKCVC